MLSSNKILVTGAAGFIGFHAVRNFCKEGYDVVGLDNINDYYDVRLKLDRLAVSGINEESIEDHIQVKSSVYSNYRFVKADLIDKEFLHQLFESERFDCVCHLAAQAGVRNSINNPYPYIHSNIYGFLNMLECCRHQGVKHFLYASSSSVYGQSNKVPFNEHDQVDSPVSLYAATKKSNELMAHAYSKLYKIPTTGIRFFTVYGPWGRPDMAPSLFMDSIAREIPIKIFNHGMLARDFTYIEDIINGLAVVIKSIPEGETPYKIYNLGKGEPVGLLEFIETIERTLGKKAIRTMVEMQDGDVYQTFADTNAIAHDFNYRSKTSITEGIEKLFSWYKTYYKEK